MVIVIYKIYRKIASQKKFNEVLCSFDQGQNEITQ